MNHNKKQVDYTLYEAGRQLKLPMETEIFIAADDPVRLVSAVVERMDIGKIERSYSQDGRNEYPPRILLKVMICAYMRLIYSSREIERACRENICFMYLLEENPAPDHNKIARFRSQHLLECEKDLLEQFVAMLVEWGFVSLARVFIDGTKIEANANRYSFVWRKSTEKKTAKLKEQIKKELPILKQSLALKWHVPEAPQIHHFGNGPRGSHEFSGGAVVYQVTEYGKAIWERLFFVVLSGWFCTFSVAIVLRKALFSTIYANSKRRCLSIAIFAILRQRPSFAFPYSGSYSPYSQPMWVASTSSTSTSAPSFLSYSFTVPQPLPPFHRRLWRLLPSGAS